MDLELARVVVRVKTFYNGQMQMVHFHSHKITRPVFPLQTNVGAFSTFECNTSLELAVKIIQNCSQGCFQVCKV